MRASVTSEWLEICRLDNFDILKLLGTESDMLGCVPVYGTRAPPPSTSVA